MRSKIFLLFLALTITSESFCKREKTGSAKNYSEEDIPATEDLMKEHGVLNRLLLIYEEIIKRLEHSESPINQLAKAVTLVKTFIEDYHEKNEEEYIFPLFEHDKKMRSLTQTLLTQHVKGREITAQIEEILVLEEVDKKSQKKLKTLLKKFITMYRPHEAREDTVLFPQVRGLMSEKEFKELGEYFEQSEHALFGEAGFEGILKQVEDIEKELGIYKLEQFTPTI